MVNILGKDWHMGVSHSVAPIQLQRYKILERFASFSAKKSTLTFRFCVIRKCSIIEKKKSVPSGLLVRSERTLSPTPTDLFFYAFPR